MRTVVQKMASWILKADLIYYSLKKWVPSWLRCRSSSKIISSSKKKLVFITRRIFSIPWQFDFAFKKIKKEGGNNLLNNLYIWTTHRKTGMCERQTTPGTITIKMWVIKSLCFFLWETNFCLFCCFPDGPRKFYALFRVKWQFYPKWSPFTKI